MKKENGEYAAPSQSLREVGDDEDDEPAPKPPIGERLLSWLRHLVLRRNGETLKEVIEEVIEDAGSNGGQQLSSEEKDLLHNVLHFGELRVEDIMTPRARIVGVEFDAKLEDIRKVITESEHTRLPVYRRTLDDAVGFLHVKDVFPFFGGTEHDFSIDKVMRKLLVVPPSMRVADLLVRMRLSGTHIALVVDEYGGTDGLVTLEDIFEEIVGDIQDEHDAPSDEEYIHWVTHTIIEADARLEIDKLEDLAGQQLLPEGKEEEVDTLGGLIFTMLGRVPEVGEPIIHPSGLKFIILEADPRRVSKVRVILKRQKPAEATQ